MLPGVGAVCWRGSVQDVGRPAARVGQQEPDPSKQLPRSTNQRPAPSPYSLLPQVDPTPFGTIHVMF